jgi:hypothetical protein
LGPLPFVFQQRIIPHQTSIDDSRLIDPRFRSMTAPITPFRAPQPESRGFAQPSTPTAETRRTLPLARDVPAAVHGA